MKVAILAGGKGSRLSEETGDKSKAMVRIGEAPILWHIMKYYESHGMTEFVIALGHHGDSVRRYFHALGARRPVFHDGVCETHHPAAEPTWTVHLVETGQDTMSGGRIKRLAPYIGRSGPFMLTWCDGVSDVPLDKLLEHHRAHGRLATLTAVHPPAKFGRLALSGDAVKAFREKEVDPDEWVNGAFFVLEPAVFDYVEGDHTQWELEPLCGLAADDALRAYRHTGFWQCMDTLHECKTLNDLWAKGDAPWHTWTTAPPPVPPAAVRALGGGVVEPSRTLHDPKR